MTVDFFVVLFYTSLRMLFVIVRALRIIQINRQSRRRLQNHEPLLVQGKFYIAICFGFNEGLVKVLYLIFNLAIRDETQSLISDLISLPDLDMD